MSTRPNSTPSHPHSRVFLFVFVAMLLLWVAAWHTPSSKAATVPASDGSGVHDILSE